jgi:hypothetical protein
MRWGALACFVVAALAPGRAIAAGAVVGREGETAVLTSARLAVAIAPARHTLWAQVSVSGVGRGFAWIVPVRAGGRIDLASDAWLDALDAATTPVVLPPSAIDPAVECVAPAPQVVPPATSPRSTEPAASGVFIDVATLTAFVQGAGYTMPQDLTTALGAHFASGSSVFAATYASAALPTHTLRIVDDGPPLLPFALSATAASDTPVTAFVVASAGATAGASPLVTDPTSISWSSDGTSTYVSARDALLATWDGARWYTETASPDLLFGGAVVLGQVVLPAAIGNYFELASSYGDASADPAACAMAAAVIRSESIRRPDGCPPGALGVVPGPGPCSPPEGGVEDAGDGAADDGGEAGPGAVDGLECGGADDAALALASLAPASAWVSRIDGLITATSASDVPLSIESTLARAPSRVATSGGPSCNRAPPPVPTSSPTWPPSTPSEPSTAYVPPPDNPAPATAAAAAEGCGAAADGCSSSSDPSDDGSDGSSACSSQPSSEGDDSGGCGSSTDSSASDCTAGRRTRGKRSPVSRVLVLFAAVAVVVRRHNRPRGA